ncbi:hypothetical protein ACH474_13120 [Nocardia rhamnosiphila]|uniref:hypothetical protein n=1 Tax=Nocardia rhamnosiphila TaxID=426716 RepID=UPI0037B43AAA
MALWDGVGDFFSEHGADIAVGAVSVAGFAVGGPLGAAVAGGIAGGVAAGFKDENILMGAGLGVAGGLVGGLGGVAFRGSAKGIVGGLLRQGHSLDIARGMGAGAEKIAFQRSGLFARRIPELLGGAHLSPWKTYVGLLNTAFTPYYMGVIENAPDDIRNKWYKYMGYPDIPLIDISEEELSAIPDKMPHIMMPDPARLPKELELTAPVEKNYRTLPTAYAGYWNSFGEKPGKLDPPKELVVGDISGEEKAGVANYPQKVEKMRSRLAELRSKAAKVEEASEQTSRLCAAGRGDFAQAVKALTGFAGLDPRDMKRIGVLFSDYSQKTSEYTGQPVFRIEPASLGAGPPSEDVYAMVLVDAAYGSAATILSWYADAFEALGARTESAKPTAEQSRSGQNPGSTATTPTTNGNDPYYDAAAAAGARIMPTTQPRPSTVPAPTPWDLTGDTGSGSGSDRKVTDDPVGGAADGLGTATTTPDASSVAPAKVPAVSAAGNDMGSALKSMMLPQMMQAFLGRNRPGAGTEPEKDHRDGRERPEDFAPPAPAPVPAPAANAVPAAQQPGSPAATAPNGETRPAVARPDSGRPPGNPVPATAPDTKGTVVYTVPDGRTVEVSAVVARGLDAAFGNASGTDARAAYTGTPAEWTDPKRIGRRIDPSESVTGDVGVWEERNAILVQFDGQDVLEAVVDGALVKVTELSQMRDDAGDFGGFVGIFHPPGIEKVADESAATAVPGAPADPTGAGATVSV